VAYVYLRHVLVALPLAQGWRSEADDEPSLPLVGAQRHRVIWRRPNLFPAQGRWGVNISS